MHALVAAEPVKQSWWAWLRLFAAHCVCRFHAPDRGTLDGLYATEWTSGAWQLIQSSRCADDAGFTGLEDHDVLTNFEPLKELPPPVQAEDEADSHARNRCRRGIVVKSLLDDVTVKGAIQKRLVLGAMLLAMARVRHPCPGVRSRKNINPNRSRLPPATQFPRRPDTSACYATIINHERQSSARKRESASCKSIQSTIRAGPAISSIEFQQHPIIPAYNGGAKLNHRQQLGVGSPRPWVDTMRSLSPRIANVFCRTAKRSRIFLPTSKPKSASNSISGTA